MTNRRGAIIAAAAGVLVLAGAVLVIGGRDLAAPSRGATAPTVASPTSPSASRSGQAAAAEPDPLVQRVQAVLDAALGRRAGAALEPHLSATRAAQLRRNVAGELWASQLRLARNLTRVPLLSYSLQAAGAPTLQEVRRGLVHQTVTQRYRLVGDATTSQSTVDTTFERRSGRWVLTRWRPDQLLVWDVGRVSSQRDGRVLVVGDVPADRVASVADAARRALAMVRATWPYRWSQRVTVLVPADVGDLAALTGESRSSLDGLAALTDTTSPDHRGRAAVRVTVNPTNYWDQSALARQIVLRHELTHVAQLGLGPRRNSQVPQWMKEGLADYVGYLDSGVPFDAIGSDLLDRVRGGRLPALPKDRDFAFGRPGDQRALAYRAGWTFCVYLADRYGPTAPFAFYRALATAQGSRQHRVDGSLRAVTGQGQADVVPAWHTWLLGRA